MEKESKEADLTKMEKESKEADGRWKEPFEANFKEGVNPHTLLLDSLYKNDRSRDARPFDPALEYGIRDGKSIYDDHNAVQDIHTSRRLLINALNEHSGFREVKPFKEMPDTDVKGDSRWVATADGDFAEKDFGDKKNSEYALELLAKSLERPKYKKSDRPEPTVNGL